ncbi:hypothetical protein [Paeniglutamicibacter cryotolerans]|uniref:Uncharacterized protein n=1 Tax=Paeniglutamicibacter cryotolerans TaxID=670079 RepID=A0A839QJY4_9MICC|nr:hypothetical protein [Paeniglutamicibacter cryotolerans]MBB2995903.1 hypothetical protein [Paeniglutamicibacter cryotolerans]
MPITEDSRSLDIREIEGYLRQDRGHAKKVARYLARQVFRDEETSKRELPSGWHSILHPPKVSFVRRMGWSPFKYGGGTQIIRTQENGPEVESAKSHFEAV